MIYRLVIENLPHRISVKDVSLAYVLCNDAYARGLQIKPDEIQGKKDHDFFPKEQAEKNSTEENEILVSGVKKGTEGKYMVSGNELTIRTIKIPIKNEYGDVIGLQIIWQDITQDMHRAESLASRNEHLEALLVRTKESISALQADLLKMTAGRDQLERQIGNMQERMKKGMAMRDARIADLKKTCNGRRKSEKAPLGCCASGSNRLRMQSS
jgi:PAS domain S-box-containing protein